MSAIGGWLRPLLLALLVSLGLIGLYRLLAPWLELSRLEPLRSSLVALLPPESLDNNPAQNCVLQQASPQGPLLRIYRAFLRQQPAALIYRLDAVPGYGGPMQILIALTLEGEILNVRVNAHQETPGWGSQVELAQSNWILGFNRLSLANRAEPAWAIRQDGGDFDQFTQASITPRAVVQAVKATLVLYRQQGRSLFEQANACKERR